eukprot:m.125041 g.125041  ORF g.125041 m.125041 type:complete len:139 (-) comp17313_c0_seq3:3321-3737(-)
MEWPKKVTNRGHGIRSPKKILCRRAFVVAHIMPALQKRTKCSQYMPSNRPMAKMSRVRAWLLGCWMTSASPVPVLAGAPSFSQQPAGIFSEQQPAGVTSGQQTSRGVPGGQHAGIVCGVHVVVFGGQHDDDDTMLHAV